MDRRWMIRRAAWWRLLGISMACVLVFVAGYVTHVRWDWTEDQVYSLSDSTRNVLQTLDEPILIRAYVSEGMPQPYGRLRQFLVDMLLAYHDAGHGNVDFEMVNPDANSTVAASLQALNIPKVQVRVVEDDRAQIKQGYMAVVLEYLDHKETIPVVQSESGFEYLLTRKIKKLTGAGRHKIGVANGYGAFGLDQLQRFAGVMTEDYEVVSVDPEAEPIATDIVALIVAGVDKKPSETWRYHVDQFRMRGGGVLLFTGNAKPNLTAGFAVSMMDPYTSQWLAKDLGVHIEPGLVMDQKATRVTVNRQQGIYTFSSQVDYPFVPRIVSMGQDSPVTQELEAVSMPFPSPLALPAGAVPLMYSSDWSAVQGGPPFDVNPLMNMQQRFAGLQMRPSLLAWSKAGTVSSAFTAMPESLQSASAEESKTTEPDFMARTDVSSLVVVGAPAMLNDDFFDGSTAVFVLNAIDWLVHDEGVISLRSRGVSERPLEQMDASEREMYKFFWTFGLALLVVLAGVARWRLLRRRSRRIPALA